MNIDKAVIFLEYKKLKLKFLTFVIDLLPNFIYKKVENLLDKDVFRRKPEIIRLISFLINTSIFMIIYFVLYFLFSHILIIETLYAYILEVTLLVILIFLYQVKNDFFAYFARDHFFNLLGNKQSEFIIKRIGYVYKGIFANFFLPSLIPVYLHFLFIDYNGLLLLIIPLFSLLVYQFSKIFIVIFWYLNILVKRYFILSWLFTSLKYNFTIIVYMGIGLVSSQLVTAYLNKPLFRLNDGLLTKLNLFLLTVCILFNIILFFIKDIPHKVIDESYKKIIYSEGNNWQKQSFNDSGFIGKILSLGMINLDKKERAIYEKDVKCLIRSRHGKVYTIIAGLLLMLYSTFFALIPPYPHSTDDFFTMYMFLNVFMTIALGYFLALHKHVTAYSVEGENHLIYHKLHVDFYKVFHAKLSLNRFIVLFPVMPYFIIYLFKIRSIVDLGIYLSMVGYFLGMINLVIRAMMIDDFYNPRFMGQKYSKTSFLGSFFSYYLLYIFFIFPYAISALLKEIDLWIIICSLVFLINLLNYLIYRKSLNLKKVRDISYGGVSYVND